LHTEHRLERPFNVHLQMLYTMKQRIVMRHILADDKDVERDIRSYVIRDTDDIHMWLLALINSIHNEMYKIC